jgi:hypothetical protein
MRAVWRPGPGVLGRGRGVLEEGIDALALTFEPGDLRGLGSDDGLGIGEGGTGIGELSPEGCDLASLALAVGGLSFGMGLGHTSPLVRGLRHVTLGIFAAFVT